MNCNKRKEKQIMIKNEEDFKEAIQNIKLLEGRNKIIQNNNTCIIETIAFYEYALLDDIIKPYLFNENYDNCPEVDEILSEKLSIMDKYKIVCKIAKKLEIENFKRFDKFIKIRNEIAHNLSSVTNIETQGKESEIRIGKTITSWSEYKKNLKNWAELSKEMAEFILSLFEKINSDKKNMFFVYCKVEANCILVQHCLLFPRINDDYTCFFKSGFNTDLLEYTKNEYNLEKSNN